MMDGNMDLFKKQKKTHKYIYIYMYLDPPRGAKWMLKGATKQPLRVQTPPLGGCWYIYIYMLAPPPQDPYFYMLTFPKAYNTVHPVHLACLEAKYLVPEGFTVLRIFFFNRALPGSSC